MDSNPYVNINFVDLLQSQQDTSSIPFLTTQATEGINFQQETSSGRKERRTWSPTDDIVLISSWLNMRKDPLVGNEQRSIAFWKRIAAYFAASPKLAGSEKRESSHCKQRWHRINDLVSKFCGAYEAATIEKSSGQNENDVLKLAHEIFFTNYKKKFTLEHAWKELRNDQKWCDFSTAKTGEIEECSSHAKVLRLKLHGHGTLFLSKKQGKKRKKKRAYIERNREEGHVRLWNDYFSETPTYPGNFFRCRFRMNKPLFMHIVGRLSNEVQFFRQKEDALGRLGLSTLQKCTSAIRVLAYGTAADTVDEYLRLGESTTRKCLEHFVEGIIHLFGEEYVRRPTSTHLQRLLDVGEHRGFPGMIGSIDCMHWEWKNCLTAWKWQYSRGS
uniref:Myb-like domain-containing protein n=1 Tax=Brassica oleracea var. oleracea TaxID=109376 RepID=A0A0D3D9D3_BRAOL